jgi:hypothetical protein
LFSLIFTDSLAAREDFAQMRVSRALVWPIIVPHSRNASARISHAPVESNNVSARARQNSMRWAVLIPRMMRVAWHGRQR